MILFTTSVFAHYLGHGGDCFSPFCSFVYKLAGYFGKGFFRTTEGKDFLNRIFLNISTF